MNVTSLVKEFFVENEFDLLSEKVAIIRQDGNVLYANSINSLEASNIGALVSGVWQAAQSLSSLVNKSQLSREYRLSFDTSSDGIYILPVSLGESPYYFCSIFKDRMNPGKLKQNMRSVSFLLEAYMREELLSLKAPQDSKESSGYLFENITDAEMDQLFVATGI
ncbi:MAG: hypothetical protein WEB87_05480 [Bacteriovoracaceae bacterium]